METIKNHSKACCQLPSFKSDYKPTGTYLKIGEADVYSTGPPDAKIALVVIYDIFGMQPNTQQGADLLARQLNCRVVMPDFFYGMPWPVDKKPEDHMDLFGPFIGGMGKWEIIRPLFRKVVDKLRADGAVKIGTYGFCWGGKMCISATKENIVSAVAIVHPAMLESADAVEVSVPVCLLPSGDEDRQTMDDFWAEVQKKTFANKCVYKYYEDMHHGFAAARSDWQDPLLGSRAHEAYTDLCSFFENVL